MKAIIIEDSRLARLELANMLAEYDQLQIVAQTGDPDEGIQLIKQHQPDVLFLDIQMPSKNGFEVLDAVNFKGQLIFTTAYDEYAIRSFEYDVFDYLLKPIEPQRLTVSIEKLKKHISDENNSELAPITQLDAQSSVFLKDGEQCDFVPLKNIYLIESCGNYCFVHYERYKPLLKKSLNLLESRLPQTLFFRANRQQIINLQHIQQVDLAVNANLLITLKQGQEIEVSRRHSSRFKQLMSL